MEIVNLSFNGIGENKQSYSNKDENLLSSTVVNSTFGDVNDYIEAFISDENGNILSYNYNLQSYVKTAEVNSGTNKFTSIILDPVSDVKNEGFNRGIVNIQYNFLKNLFNSNSGKFYWIKEISSSRLELKLSSQNISGNDMQSGLTDFQSYLNQKNYFGDFYLNFGNNNLIIAINAAYINDGTNSYILIKLYEPLPIDFDIKDKLWIVDKISESYSFQVNIQVETPIIIEENKLRGPNFKITTTQKVGQTTPYYSYNSLFSSPISSSIQQLISYYDDKAVSINVDYTSFDNFIHFSNATERIQNFVYKLGLIETYNQQIISQSAILGNSQVQQITSGSIVTLQNSINSIIQKFDGYEYYLYYTSGAFAWPKSTSSKPYELYSVTSSAAYNWLGSETTIPSLGITSILYSSSLYDNINNNSLRNSIPQYLLDDPTNQSYITFIDMIGQHFDNIWIYYKDVSNRFNATNNPDTGISLDLVADAIKGLGIELYTNTNLSDSTFYSLFGINENGNSLPPTGSEGSPIYPISYVTSSLETLPYDQIQKEVYKRIYHNLPYLLKTRGTERGIKALIACYGIPDTILTINEFGGTSISGSYDVIQLNDSKINIPVINELSGSLLSLNTSIQQYSSDYNKNSTNIEIGFSPSDAINANITSSLGLYSIDSLIGRPTDQYSSSYADLDSTRDTYFQAYTGKHSISEYIRLIKFYNNSLFKMLKDFVPARASLSSGIIIKPHILERNKYARHEPSASFQDYSQSIDMVVISGSSANSYTIDTTTNILVTSSLGYIPTTNSFGFEKYSGEFQGTKIIATDLNSVGDQTELSLNSIYGPININLGALYQNVSASVRSKRYLDLDYTSNANTPINYDLITESIQNSQIDNYSTYTNPNNPYAELQDFNYFAQRSTIPRYYGSRVESYTYNVYTPATGSWPGDRSYGNSPAIDHTVSKLGLFNQISTSSFLPGKVNVRMGYLVDASVGLYELNLLNNNWFEVQNTFKAGTYLTIKQFDNTKYSNQKFTDGQKLIYESGYSYSPILYFNQQLDKKVYFNYLGEGLAYLQSQNYPASASANPNNFIYGNSVSIGNWYTGSASGSNFTQSIYNIFDNEQVDPNDNYSPGVSGISPYSTYTVNFAGNYSINLNFGINITASATTDSASFSIKVVRTTPQGVRTVITSSNKILQYAPLSPPDNNLYVAWGAGIVPGD
jgi:hypothetical protein